MKGIKRFTALALGFLLVFSSFTINALASDFRSGGREVGGTYVSYSHYLTYTDQRCAMNTQSHYQGNANRAIGTIGVKWSVKSVFTGGNLDSGGVTHSNRGNVYDQSANRLPISESNADFTFKNNGSSWTPNSRAFHCTSVKSLAEEDQPSDVVRDTLKELYNQLKNGGKNTLNSNLEQDITEVVEKLLADNETDVTEFTFKNGKELSVSDFNIVNLAAENSKTPVADGVTFYNTEEDNTSIIELDVKETVFKDENEYKLSGYVVFIDGEEQNLESGIFVELVK
ncbi:hypothetical protein [Oceanobacillus luteolus]|uniref:Uncharacterized protein n=1 Tax=Oceanobacillus luteolus TaxID=1274358 RepID=A0ABW4HRU1_9BACI